MRSNMFYLMMILSATLLFNGCVAIEEFRSSVDSVSVGNTTPQPAVADEPLLNEVCVVDQTVRDIQYYQNYIEDPSGENLEREIKEVAGYNQDEIGFDEQLRVILLSLHPKISPSDNFVLNRILDSIQIDSQDEEQKLVRFLLEISRRHVTMRMQKDILSEELGASLNKVITLDQDLVAERKKSENLQKQLQGLKDIEKIILKREKGDLPNH